MVGADRTQKLSGVLVCGLLAAMVGLNSSTIRAADYSGRLTLGILSAQERYAEEAQGTQSNDHAMVSSRGFLDVINIGGAKHEFTLDARDKHDMYGKINKSTLKLEPANRFGLRQLAYKSSRSAKLLWKVGRFPLIEAGLQRNDGVFTAYQLSDRITLGAFGGLGLPQAVKDKNASDSKAAQGGVTAVYQQKNANAAYFYSAQSIYLGPAAFEDDDEKQLYVFHQGVFLPSARLSVSTLLLGLVSPKSSLQNILLAVDSKPTPTLDLKLSYNRIDLTQYEDRRELRDALVASDYQEGALELLQKIQGPIGVKGKARYGRRSIDGLTRSEIALGPTATRLLGKRMNAEVLFGLRENYLSRDRFMHGRLHYYDEKFDLGLEQQIIEESYEESEKVLHPKITLLTGNVIFSRSLLGGVGLEYASDEEVTLTAFMLTVGYRFGQRTLTPVRHEAPSLEEL